MKKKCVSCLLEKDSSEFLEKHAKCIPCFKKHRKEYIRVWGIGRKGRKLLVKEKKCKICGETKDSSLFLKPWGNKDGLTSTCTRCYGLNRKSYDSMWREKNKDRVEKTKKLHYELNKDSLKNRYKTYVQSARKRGVVFELTVGEFDILTKGLCVYCGGRSRFGREKEYVGIDQIEPSLGYTSENSIPCCDVCNIIKRDLSLLGFLSTIGVICARISEIYKDPRVGKYLQRTSLSESETSEIPKFGITKVQSD